MPHIHLGLQFAISVMAHWMLIAIPLKIVALWLHNTRIGQALAFVIG